MIFGLRPAVDLPVTIDNQSAILALHNGIADAQGAVLVPIDLYRVNDVIPYLHIFFVLVLGLILIAALQAFLAAVLLVPLVWCFYFYRSRFFDGYLWPAEVALLAVLLRPLVYPDRVDILILLHHVILGIAGCGPCYSFCRYNRVFAINGIFTIIALEDAVGSRQVVPVNFRPIRFFFRHFPQSRHVTFL